MGNRIWLSMVSEIGDLEWPGTA